MNSAQDRLFRRGCHSSRKTRPVYVNRLATGLSEAKQRINNRRLRGLGHSTLEYHILIKDHVGPSEVSRRLGETNGGESSVFCAENNHF